MILKRPGCSSSKLWHKEAYAIRNQEEFALSMTSPFPPVARLAAVTTQSGSERRIFRAHAGECAE